MPGRPDGSFAITLAVAVVAMAGAFSLAALAVTPGNPVRTIAEAMLRGPATTRPDILVASGRDDEPEFTGSVVLPLRREH